MSPVYLTLGPVELAQFLAELLKLGISFYHEQLPDGQHKFTLTGF